jgi:hypothetical protein
MQISAAELNESERHIRTIFEEPYPTKTSCHYWYEAEEDANHEDGHDNENEEDGPEAFKRKLPWIEAHASTWQDLGQKTFGGSQLRPCQILSRQSGTSDEVEDTYTVQVYNPERIFEGFEIPSEYNHYVKGVPRRAILFQDSEDTSNQQNVNAFRHEIGFPDNLWPQAWIDNKQ